MLSPYHKKVAHSIYINVEALCQKHGLERIGFLTLTFAEDVEWREGQRRFHSLATGFLADAFLDYLCVVEFQKSGRVHYHLLVACHADIRSGLDFAQVAQRNYSSANPYLRGLWAKLREVLTRYGFGRHELLPIQSNAEGIGRYVGKYISKCVPNRKPEHRGVRFVRYSRGFRVCYPQFAWNTAAAWLWRKKLALLADKSGVATLDAAKQVWGKHWAYDYAKAIQAVRLNQWPTVAHAVADGFMTWDEAHELARLDCEGRDPMDCMVDITRGVSDCAGSFPPDPCLTAEAVARLIMTDRRARGRRRVQMGNLC